MTILAVIEPLPVVGQPQIEPHLIERRIGFSQMPLPRGAALTLSVKPLTRPKQSTVVQEQMGDEHHTRNPREPWRADG